MAFKYILIKNISEQDKNIFNDFIIGLMGNKIDIIDNGNLEVIHSFESDNDIFEAIEALISDLQLNICVYISKGFNEYNELNKEKLIIAQHFYEISLLKRIYEEKEFLLELLSKGVKSNLNSVVLKEFVKDNQMLEILKVFANTNLNTSKSAEKLYMHRNTLINKLDKFTEITSYDPKKFIDCFIIYHLI